MGEHRLDDGFAAIRGPRRVRADPQAGAPIGESEAPKGQELLEFDQMLPARLAPARVFAEQRRVDADLFRDKGEHRRWRRLQRFERAAGIAERAKLDGEAQAIGRAPLGSHERQIFGLST